MKKIIIIQPSLRKDSYTAKLAQKIQFFLQSRENIEVEILDLRNRKLEFCDGREIQEYNADMQADYQKIRQADIIVFGFPIYHFAVSGVLKNYIDIISDSLEGKQIDFFASGLLPGGEIAYEHLLQSLEKKYGVQKASAYTPYILNSCWKMGILTNTQAQESLEKFAFSL